jgi:acyl carrier protein
MTPKEIEAAVIAELHQIAPDIGMEDVDRSADLREEFDIDSMDFLNLVTALGKAFGTEMPEADYPQMRSFEGMVSYLQEQAG